MEKAGKQCLVASVTVGDKEGHVLVVRVRVRKAGVSVVCRAVLVLVVCFLFGVSAKLML